tara:strand:+ start:122 stop:418 length:297 start_codon:yes stop_codon:yes gene_type:complete
MQSSSYSALIDEKMEEWRKKLAKLRERQSKTDAKSLEEFTTQLKQLDLAVNSAALELRDLDSQENAANTLVIKEKILKIFDSIDKDLVDYEDKTPFML